MMTILVTMSLFGCQNAIYPQHNYIQITAEDQTPAKHFLISHSDVDKSSDSSIIQLLIH